MRLLQIIPNKKSLLSKLLFFKKKFIFNGISLPYTVHLYNHTYANERAIEISIFKYFLSKKNNQQILEIGNVLNHYTAISHTVVDKYEQAQGVINQDIIDYQTNKKFDSIFAISTFEHIGFDEEDKDNEKIIKVIKHLKKLLKKGGKLYFSVPIGHNPHLDKIIRNNKFKLDRQFFLQRINSLNFWTETGKRTALKKKYNSPYSNANAIMVGIINN